MFDVVEDKHIDIALALADGFVHETTPQNIEPWLDPAFPRERLDEYLRTVTRPLRIAGVREFLKDAINANLTDAVRAYVILANVLGLRIGAPVITNSLTLISEMSLAEREKLLNAWKLLPIAAKQKLFRLFHLLTMFAFNAFAPELHNRAIGYPGKELRDVLYDLPEPPADFRYEMLAPPTQDGNELYMPNIDVVIIGSGLGAGVVAHTLAQQNYTCLVVEKGQYFHKLELAFNDVEALTNLYELRGVLTTTDQSLTVLAGATFGGGLTVNWLALLKTPFKVRKEWFDDHGVEWAASEHFDNCTDYVLQQMGATTRGIEHSFLNRVLLDGCAQLGYAAKEVPQNIGSHQSHDCGMCHMGCKFGIKQGLVECWFRDAAANGTQFMTGVEVERLEHAGGKAAAAVCRDVASGVRFRITGPKKFVVCGGLLHTPVVLQRLGFKNRHIGANLKLHPVLVLFGDFGNANHTEPFNHPILTSVCTEVDDLDGKAHGAKVETILHTPLLETVFYPWLLLERLRRDFLRYNNLAAMLLITRDTTSGTVRCDEAKPSALLIDYVVNKFDRDALREALLVAADMLYVSGAVEIVHPHNAVALFRSAKPKEQRLVQDADFAAWRAKVARVRLTRYSTMFGLAHQMSLCRISGKGPRHGACDQRGRLYECSNVYVADASAMPTASGVNPMVTTMTLARVVALGIAKDLEPKANL